MKRLATEREKEIRSLGDDNEFALFDAKEELLAEIDALRAEISRLHDRYDFQLLVKQRERCEKLANELPLNKLQHKPSVALIEAFAREIRNEALEEAIEVAEKYDVFDANFSPYQVQIEICSDIRALVLLEKDSK